VAPPHQLRDHRTHRIADRNETVDVELIRQRDNVVGALFEQEPWRRDAGPVPALVEHHHAPELAQRFQRGIPGEQAGAPQGVQQDKCRSTV
jgi:hypothetical protein